MVSTPAFSFRVERRWLHWEWYVIESFAGRNAIFNKGVTFKYFTAVRKATKVIIAENKFWADYCRKYNNGQ